MTLQRFPKKQDASVERVAAALSATIRGLAVNPKDWGARGDGVTDDWPAFKAAHDSIAALSGGDTWVGAEIRIPRGRYYLSKTWEITKHVKVVGEGGGYQHDNAATGLIFPANTTGIRVYSSLESPNGNSGAYSRISDVHLYCSSRASSGHGIHASATVYLENVVVQNFAGDSIHIEASAGAGTGIANGWSIRDCHSIEPNGSGLYIAGADVNAGIAINFESHNHGKWAVYDGSYLGNLYFQCLSESGRGVGSYKTVGSGCKFEHCYIEAAGTYGTEFCTGTLVIGDNLGSEDNYPRLTITGDGSGAKAMVNGTTTGDAISSVLVTARGSGYTTAAISIVHGSGSGAVLTPVISGGKIVSVTITTPGTGYVGDLRVPEIAPDGTEGGFRTPRIKVQNRCKGTERAVDVILGRSGINGLVSVAVADIPTPSAIDLVAWNDAAKCFESQFNASPGYVGIRYIYDLSTTETGGRSSVLPGGSIEFPLGFWVGGGSTGRWVGIGTAAPTSGEHAQGDLVLNSSATAGAPWSWRCTVSGTPGTWQPILAAGVAPTATKTADYTVLLVDAGTTYSNKGAAGQVILTLPACAAGVRYRAMVETAQNVRLLATGGATIRNAGTASAANGHLDNATVGGVVELEGNPDGSSWLVTQAIGTWTPT